MKVNDLYETSTEQERKFDKYMEMLIEWNKKMNLTAITEKNDIVLKHFIDSLTISKYIEDNQKIIDIGTGAGFPGIPLKINNNSLKITLLDSINKRILFLNEVIKELELEDINTIHGRAEDYGRDVNYREKFDIATSRAVSNLSTLVEYMMPFVKTSGYCICMKGTSVNEEINNAKNAIQKLGGKIEKIEEFNLNNSDIKRSIVIIKKTMRTSLQYPRKAGIPSKKPL